MTAKTVPSGKMYIRKMVFSAMFLAIALLLPFLTGQVPQIGGMLCPMHLPVLLCGFVCGPFWGGAVGLVCPLLRHMFFSMPPLMTAITMTFELCAYGVLAGVFHRIFQKLCGEKSMTAVYIALVLAMIGGRIVWGLASSVLMLAGQTEFSIGVFFASGFAQAWPGILLQLIVIPPLYQLFLKLKLTV
ncbi:MAG: ECF transporter S component [Clostridia bacterium]|nr:ECF transporter S component [Clostridia bacterium]